MIKPVTAVAKKQIVNYDISSLNTNRSDPRTGIIHRYFRVSKLLITWQELWVMAL